MKNKIIKIKNKLVSIIIIVAIFLVGYDNIDKIKDGVNPQLQNIVIDENLIKIYALDMGQADATIVQDGETTVLIDAGNNKDEEKIVNILNELGIDKIEYVIATHPDADHIGGMDSVIQNFEIDTFFMANDTKDTKTFEDVQYELEQNNINVIIPKKNKKIILGNSIIEILPPKEEYSASNNNSIVARIIFNEFEMLFTGDMETEWEDDFLNENNNIKSDILKVAHHGSNSSTQIKFLNEVVPKIAIISAGLDNKYGHPHQEVIDRLNAKNIKIFRTDKDGNILIETDGINIKVSSDNEKAITKSAS